MIVNGAFVNTIYHKPAERIAKIQHIGSIFPVNPNEEIASVTLANVMYAVIRHSTINPKIATINPLLINPKNELHHIKVRQFSRLKIGEKGINKPMPERDAHGVVGGHVCSQDDLGLLHG